MLGTGDAQVQALLASSRAIRKFGRTPTGTQMQGIARLYLTHLGVTRIG